MTKICEHKFEYEDPNHEGYSMTEVDLFPAVGGATSSYSVRRNLESEEYEIFDFQHRYPYSDEAVDFSGDLASVISEANYLEKVATGSGSFEYGHSPSLYEDCPEDLVADF